MHTKVLYVMLFKSAFSFTKGVCHAHSPWAVLCHLQTRVPYQRPGSLRVLRWIVAVASIVLFWTEVSGVIPGICWIHPPSLGVTAPISPITTGITVAFTPHILSSSPFSPWYFMSLPCSFFLMLLSLGIATSTNIAFSSYLLTTLIFG